jgi:dolichol-phosphate mannosyltransferase
LISVVIPAYREEENVETAVRRVDRVLAGIGEPYEVVVVDDASPDATYARAQSLVRTYPQLRVLRNPHNLGPGGAFRLGFAHSRGDKVVTLDCDLSFDPGRIPTLVRELARYDVVIGAQHGTGAQMRNIPLVRVACSKMAYMLDRAVLGGGLASYSSFFCAYRGDLIRKLRFEGNGFDAQCEIYVRLLREGARISSVPCILEWRSKRRQSSMKLLREARRRLALWRQWHRFRHRSCVSHPRREG